MSFSISIRTIPSCSEPSEGFEGVWCLWDGSRRHDNIGSIPTPSLGAVNSSLSSSDGKRQCPAFSLLACLRKDSSTLHLGRKARVTFNAISIYSIFTDKVSLICQAQPTVTFSRTITGDLAVELSSSSNSTRRTLHFCSILLKACRSNF